MDTVSQVEAKQVDEQHLAGFASGARVLARANDHDFVTIHDRIDFALGRLARAQSREDWLYAAYQEGRLAAFRSALGVAR